MQKFGSGYIRIRFGGFSVNSNNSDFKMRYIYIFSIL